MSTFMIFVEGAEAPVTRAKIEAWGLAHAFDSVPSNSKMAGPGGLAGVMLANVPMLEPYQPVYRPEEQVWRKAPAVFAPGLPWHLGYYEAAKPTSADLARPEQIAGVDVPLAGEPWHVPIVRTTLLDGSAQTRLPCYIELDDEGKPRRGDVVDEHRWLLEQVTPFWDAWLAGFEAAPDDAEKFNLSLPESIFVDAAAVLSGNYYVGPVECEALRLFRSDGGLSAVMGAACDTATACAFLKKKRHERPRGNGSGVDRGQAPRL